MKNSERMMWAVGIVLLDMMVIVIPLAALTAAYVLFTRPAWFKDWVDKIYQGD